MLKNSRVGTGLDVTRLGAAIARPGIDTRIWTSLAIVKKIVFDSAEGVHVDVILMPDRQASTARLGTIYAGNGFGFYAPVEVDDEVIVEAPSGDPRQGLVITQRIHSTSDPPPGTVGSHMKDVILVVRSNQGLRLITQGSGDVIIDPQGSGKVKLGGEDASEAAAFQSALTQLKTVFNNWSPVPNDGGAALKVLLDALILTGWPVGSQKVVMK